MRENSIDGKIIKNAIGFCHYEAHPGALNMELARKHKCAKKRCRPWKSTTRNHGDKSLLIKM